MDLKEFKDMYPTGSIKTGIVFDKKWYRGYVFMTTILRDTEKQPQVQFTGFGASRDISVAENESIAAAFRNLHSLDKE